MVGVVIALSAFVFGVPATAVPRVLGGGGGLPITWRSVERGGGTGGGPSRRGETNE
jgi:hypothetical protein